MDLGVEYRLDMAVGDDKEVLSDDGMAITWEIPVPQDLADRMTRIQWYGGTVVIGRHPGRRLCGGKWRRYHRDGYSQPAWRLLAVRLSSRT